MTKWDKDKVKTKDIYIRYELCLIIMYPYWLIFLVTNVSYLCKILTMGHRAQERYISRTIFHASFL